MVCGNMMILFVHKSFQKLLSEGLRKFIQTSHIAASLTYDHILLAYLLCELYHSLYCVPAIYCIKLVFRPLCGQCFQVFLLCIGKA